MTNFHDFNYVLQQWPAMNRFVEKKKSTFSLYFYKIWTLFSVSVVSQNEIVWTVW